MGRQWEVGSAERRPAFLRQLLPLRHGWEPLLAARGRHRNPVSDDVPELQPTGGEALGPLFAMVGEAKGGVLWHGEIPYWDGRRVDTTQLAMGETVVRFTDGSGEAHEFPSVVD